MTGGGIENSDSLSVEQWQYRTYAKTLTGPTSYTIAPQFSQQGWRILKLQLFAGDGVVTLSGDIVNSAHGGDAIPVQANACLVLEPKAYTSLESELLVDVAGTSAFLLVEYIFKTVPGNVEPDIVKVP